jgi:hypothetical protein
MAGVAVALDPQVTAVPLAAAVARVTAILAAVIVISIHRLIFRSLLRHLQFRVIRDEAAERPRAYIDTRKIDGKESQNENCARDPVTRCLARSVFLYQHVFNTAESV